MEKLVAIIITLLMIGTIPAINAQNDDASKNVVYIEALGNGFNYVHETIFGTVNFERSIIYSQEVNFSIRMGFGYNYSSQHNPYSSDSKHHSFYSCPILFNYISEPYGNHHVEAGLGIVLTNDAWVDTKNFEIGYTGSIKYRYQKKTKGIYFSAGWTPTVYFDPYYNSGPQLVHFFDIILHLVTIGTSVGYHF